MFYAIWPILNSYSDVAPYFANLADQHFEWNVVSQFGELTFLYFPHLLMIAALILFVAIVSPVMLTYITFFGATSSFSLLPKKQDIFTQTLRLSIDVNFK